MRNSVRFLDLGEDEEELAYRNNLEIRMANVSDEKDFQNVCSVKGCLRSLQ